MTVDDYLCMHEVMEFTHAGESMDTWTCLLCGMEWAHQFGPHMLGTMLQIPEEQRPSTSRPLKPQDW